LKSAREPEKPGRRLQNFNRNASEQGIEQGICNSEILRGEKNSRGEMKQKLFPWCREKRREDFEIGRRGPYQ
jgi:hypothetical protein